MSDGNLGIEGIGQISIVVSDVDRAVAFYRDVLGLQYLFGFPGMAFFDCGGVRLYLAKAEKPEFDRTSIIYYLRFPISLLMVVIGVTCVIYSNVKLDRLNLTRKVQRRRADEA